MFKSQTTVLKPTDSVTIHLLSFEMAEAVYHAVLLWIVPLHGPLS